MRYKLIGQTKQLLPVLLRNSEGKLEEHRFIRGKTMVIDESQLTSHARKFLNKKSLKLVETEEPVAEKSKPVVASKGKEKAKTGVVATETDMNMEASQPKKRGRKKKVAEVKAEE